MGAGRVNPWQTLHAEAYRAAHGPRARCPLGRRVAAREVSLGAMDAFLLRNRIGGPLVVGGLLYMRVAEYTRSWRALNRVL